jgi:hypothetical protein
VAHSNGNEGLVGISKLRKVKKEAGSPSKATDPKRPTPPKANAPAPAPKPILRPYTIEECPDRFFSEKELKLFRVIGPTNRMAKFHGDKSTLVPLEKKPNAFKVFNGHIFCDRSEVQIVTRTTATVHGLIPDTQMTMPTRRLQRLERPWGLPKTLPTLDSQAIPQEGRALERLRQLMEQRELVPGEDDQFSLREKIRAWNYEHLSSITLWRVRRDVCISKDGRKGAKVALLKDEIVYKVPNAQEGQILVRDFEGVEYEVDEDSGFPRTLGQTSRSSRSPEMPRTYDHVKHPSR